MNGETPKKMSAFKRGGVIVGALLLSTAGIFVALGAGSDDRGLAWRRRHFDTVRREMTSLASLLKAHRDKHGRYPSSDEGLASLDAFETRFKATYPRPVEGDDDLHLFRQMVLRPLWHEQMAECIADFRKSQGRLPESVDDLVGVGVYQYPPPYDPVNMAEIEIGIDSSSRAWAVSSAGVLSPWGLPYAYENASGPAGAERGGAGLCVGDDRCSVTVDEGVVIHSVGSHMLLEEYDSAWWAHYTPRFIGLAMFVASVILVVRLGRDTRGPGYAVGVGLFAGALGATMGMTTCYVMAPIFSRRRPGMVKMRVDLLEEQHRNGVISDSAYKKTMEFYVFSKSEAGMPEDGAEQD